VVFAHLMLPRMLSCNAMRFNGVGF